MVLGELAGNPAPEAEVGGGAPALLAGTLAVRADAPAFAAGARSAAPAFLGLVRRAARLPEEVEVEGESAAMAAARAIAAIRERVKKALTHDRGRS